ncbi:hypothetical protein RB195_002229 [Necator americanus]|uniref:Uncharacterized protein n=1 Tax=Necator americanus TaxID=51031 RepID=A0ABR1DI08_NECAM
MYQVKHERSLIPAYAIDRLLTSLISTTAIRWLNRRLNKGLVLLIVVVLVCCLHTYRIANHDEFFIYTSRKCMFLKSKWLDGLDNERFFYRMWEAIPNIVNICSYGKLSQRIDTYYGKDGHEVKFLSNNINVFQDPEHHCDIIFVTDDGDLTIPVEMKLNIVYWKPKTYQEMVQFRNTWLRILNDRYYWLRQVSRTKDTLNMFLLSISDGYCWQKYLTWTMPNLVRF